LHSFIAPNLEEDYLINKEICKGIFSPRRHFKDAVSTPEGEIWTRVYEDCGETIQYLDKVGVFDEVQLREQFWRSFNIEASPINEH
jgi:hypothetical protein